MREKDSKTLLYDGRENQELYRRLFIVKNITFKIPNFINNKFENLKNILSQNQFQILKKRV